MVYYVAKVHLSPILIAFLAWKTWWNEFSVVYSCCFSRTIHGWTTFQVCHTEPKLTFECIYSPSKGVKFHFASVCLERDIKPTILREVNESSSSFTHMGESTTKPFHIHFLNFGITKCKLPSCTLPTVLHIWQNVKLYKHRSMTCHKKHEKTNVTT